MNNNSKYQRRYNDEDRIQMAEAYLKHGTFRKAESMTRYSRSTIHKAVTNFINCGGYWDDGDLRGLIAKNKAERSMRGGKASAARWSRK